MGAPKQKWTQEEEAALKAGIVKHGAGKWRTILKDPEFSGVLYLRSNVDLKDKWRNMTVMANGWGSREKARLALKKQHVPQLDENSLALSVIAQSDEEIVDAMPVSSDKPHHAKPQRSTVRLDNLILEAISMLREPGGSNKTAIASYIEDQYWAPPDFKRLLSTKLKVLTVSGKLSKASRFNKGNNDNDNDKVLSVLAIFSQVKRKYRIAPALATSSKRSSSVLLLEGRQRLSPRVDKDLIILTKDQIDLELGRMRIMTAEEAAEAAALAVAEAEAAIAEAEEAAREAEAAEADAEAAQAFAEAALKTVNGRNLPKTMIRA